jgi:MFS family permease
MASHPARLDQRLVLWLSLAQLITWGSVFYTFALLMEPVEAELGLTRAESSLAFSLALLLEGFCAYPIGRLIDRGQERVVMTVGSLLVGLGLALHSVIVSQWQFYAVWAILGLGMAATLYAPVFAVVTRRFPDDFRRAIITMTFLGGLASTVFIPLTAWLITALGWRHALWALAALHLLVCMPLHGCLLRDAPRARLATPLVAATTGGEASRPPALGAILTSAPFLLVGGFMVLVMAVTAALPAHMVSLLRENGLRESLVIAIPASIGVLQVFGRALLYFFEHRFDLHMANRVIPCLLPLGLAALLMAPVAAGWSTGMGAAMVVVFVLLYGMGNGMNTIVKGTAIAQYVNRDHVASLNGALGVPMALARAAAPLVMGLLWSRESGYSIGLWLLLGTSTAGVALFILAQHITRPTRQRP